MFVATYFNKLYDELQFHFPFRKYFYVSDVTETMYLLLYNV